MADLNDRTLDVNIWDDAHTKAVTITTDDLKQRLDVAANIVGGNFSLQPFVPRVEFDSVGVTITSSAWTTILDVTGTEGKLAFIGCAGSSSGYRVRLTVDSNEIFSIAMSDLSALGFSNASNLEMWAETADKNYRYRPNTAVDFTDNLKIEVMATGANVLLKFMTHYREVV